MLQGGGGMFLLALALLLLGSGQAGAQGDSLVLTGAESGAGSQYAFVGALVPLSKNLGQGWVAKFWVDHVSYRFNSGGQTITGTSPGAEALAGYVMSGDWGSVGVFTGPRYRNTTFDKGFQPGRNVAGPRLGFKGELNVNGNLGDSVRLGAISSYTSTDNYYWTRGRLTVRAVGDVEVGPEVVFQGNPEFTGQQFGLAVSNIPLGSSVALDLHGGYQRSQGTSRPSPLIQGGYFGAALIFRVGGK